MHMNSVELDAFVHDPNPTTITLTVRRSYLQLTTVHVRSSVQRKHQGKELDFYPINEKC